MGSIRGNVLRKGLSALMSALLVATMLPAASFAANDGKLKPGKVSGDASSISEGQTASTRIDVMYVDENYATKFRIDGQQGPDLVGEDPSNEDVLTVYTVNGKPDFKVKWWRYKVVDGSNDESTYTEYIAPSDSIIDGKWAVDGFTTFTHPLAGDELEGRTTYNYYVEIEDSTGAKVSLADSGEEPLRVSVGISYGRGTMESGAWKVSDAIAEGAEVSGVIQKGTSLTVMQPYVQGGTMPGAGTAYDELRQLALADGKKIAGDGTAAWQVIINDADASANVFKDGDIAVELDARAALGLGPNDDLPQGFPEDYALIRTGGSSGIVWDGMPEFVLDDEGNPTGKIKFTLRGSEDYVGNDLGSYALVAKIDYNNEKTFKITPQVGSGKGQISPMGVQEYVAGMTPTFTFLPDRGYQLKKVSVYYSGTLYKTVDGVTSQLPMPYEPDCTGMNSFTFDASITGNAWESDAQLVVDFEPVNAQPGVTFGVKVSVGSHGKVKVDDREVTNGGEVTGLASGSTFDVVFVPEAGYEVGTVQLASRSNAAGSQWSDMIPQSVIANTYTVSALNSNLWFDVTFAPKTGDETYNTVNAYVMGDSNAKHGKVYFAGNETSKEAPYGSNVEFIVEPEDGYELKNAKAHYYTGNQLETEGFSVLDGLNDAKTRLTVKVLGDMNVYFTFGPVGATSDPDNPSGGGTSGGQGLGGGSTVNGGGNGGGAGGTTPSGGTTGVGGNTNVGSVTPEETAHITLVGMKSSSGPLAGGWTSITGQDVKTKADGTFGTSSNPVVVTLGSGEQAIGFFYKGAGGKWWVIDHLIIGTSTGQRRVAVVGDTNVAKIDITGSASIEAVMREPLLDGAGSAGEGGFGIVEPIGPNGKPTLPSITSSVIPGQGGMGSGSDWTPGGKLIPSGEMMAVRGSSQTVDIVPDTAGADDFFYWTIDSVMLDGAYLIPYSDAPDGQKPGCNATGTKVFDFDPETGDGAMASGERFHYDRATGRLTFESVESAHDVSATFERAVDVQVMFNANDGGEGAVSNAAWKLYKKDGEDLAVVVEPKEGYRLVGFKVNGQDRFNEPGSTGKKWLHEATESDLAMLDASRKAKARSLKELANNKNAQTDNVVELLANALMPQAHADEATKDDGPAGYEKAMTYTFQPEDVAAAEASGNAIRNKTIPVDANFYTSQQQEPPVEDDPGANVKELEYTLTAKVASGQGWIEREGTTEASVKVKKGESYTFTFKPAAGWQVVQIRVDGKAEAYSNSTYRFSDVSKDSTVEVYYGLVSSGDSSEVARITRRITAMLSTGDASLPMMFVAMGVALGAAGVAVLVGSKRRKDERR